MLYNSLEFAVFLGASATGYHLCPLAWRRTYLLVASYAFYCAWSVPFAALLLGVTWLAFRVGVRVADAGDDADRRASLQVGVVVLLLPLVAFKYLGGLDAITGGWLSGSTTGAALVTQFAGAVGISYYTLKLISYVIDVYWQRYPPCRDFASLATYAVFFPQILSGPIQRAGDFLGQLEHLEPAQPAVVISGLQRILFGLFKKLVLADRLGVVVDQVFAQPGEFKGGVVILATYLFAIQLYADFSGLTDIAIGSGRLFGLLSPPNFDSPFYAQDIQDFWRRWHMTLTSWLGDYLFTPLRMTLRHWGEVGLALSLAINMVAIGVWHGPRLTYVVFGLVHAVYLIGSSLTLRARTKMFRRRALLRRVHAVLGPLITFNMVVASFVFFRSDTLPKAWHVLSQCVAGILSALRIGAGQGSLAGITALNWRPADTLLVIWALIVMETVHLLQRQQRVPAVLNVMPGWVRWGAYCTLGFAILLWGDTGAKQFIYVRF